MAKEQGAKIIGMKTGGGTATVGNFTDGMSSDYKLSSPYVIMGKSGDSYAHYDSGLPVDAALDSSSWYDLAKLDQFVNTLNK